jgi:hypothetical protein
MDIEMGGEAGDPVVGHFSFPSCKQIIETVRTNRGINQLLANSSFKSMQKSGVLFTETLLDPIRTGLILCLKDCLPKAKRNLGSMKKKYLVKRMLLIDNKVAELDLTSIIADEKEHREASVILHVMSFRFLESFHKLTTVPSLGAVHSVPDQVQQMMAKFANISIDEIFPDLTTQEHSYYIWGFIRHQAAKQADRRSKRGMVFKLLTHFSSTIVADGAIPTGLVERRMAFGGLKFASKQSWAIFAKIDGMYSLATPENFVFVGGTLSGDICNAIVQNPTMQQLFYVLLHQDYNPGSRVIDSALKDVLADSFAYVMKVFSCVRGKMYLGSSIAIVSQATKSIFDLASVQQLARRRRNEREATLDLLVLTQQHLLKRLMRQRRKKRRWSLASMRVC